MWIVKLGGSFADSETLTVWLQALSQSQAIIVPGGGPFADAVRHMQKRWNFSDSTAHDMAILAMRQYGLMLAELGALSTFELADFPDCRGGFSRPGRMNSPLHGPAIWLPNVSDFKDSNIEASWDVTSDSLAAWLASKLDAKNLLLIKSAAIKPDQSMSQLIQQSIIDASFKKYCQMNDFQSWICGPVGYQNIQNAFAQPRHHFCPIADINSV